jgi:hypothetical protein
MAARLMQALLLPAVLGLLSMTAPMQLLALPVRSPDTGRVLLSMPLGAQARAVVAQSSGQDGLHQIVMAAPPFAQLRDGDWQVALERPAATLKLQSDQRLLYAWRAPRIIIPRPPAAQAVAVILDKHCRLPTWGGYCWTLATWVHSRWALHTASAASCCWTARVAAGLPRACCLPCTGRAAWHLFRSCNGFARWGS